MRGKISDKIRLIHILEAIKEIEAYTSGNTKAHFFENSMMRFASIKQLEIIGEAAKHLSEETKLLDLEIAWSEIIAMRNVFVLEYFGIDNHVLWEIIQTEIPHFKSQISGLLESPSFS
ncbi:DUF86 domain-containing protein [Algoriphagus sp. A40]|uniref:HepT-like ribonuclease domain-containing protein n=1 Tax=Algoriphagus sp. A40 TaxID=1945863 RepID=UPI0009870CD0|nr:DUF86 domain-containing protein [Algoriphagus sp. A40]OOG77627.1 DUF86 domain-containing protein [Algoriphagus sp. A40]